ncbi:MAG: flagellar motor switch protein FliG [Spirochaetaceae bacterium]|nr:flagellar motor switch protein FliG [Spirochaetaceae bacterium]
MNQYENRLNAYAKAKEYSLDKKDDNDNKSEGLIKTIASNPIKEITAKNGLTPIALSQSKDGKESLYRRVAKFLLIIGVEEAAKIIPHLTQEQIDLIVPEIASIRSVDPDEATVILAEFENLVQKSRQSGGVETARSILEKAFGAQRAEEMIQKTIPFPEGKPFDYMSEMDSERVFHLLRDESPAVQVLVLSQLKPKIAAGVINQMSIENKKEVVQRLAKLQQVSPEVVKRVDRAMEEKVHQLHTQRADSIDGRGALTEIIKRMSIENEKNILQSLASFDEDLTNDIRQRLFTLDDILHADDKVIQNYLRNLEDKDIAFLIAGKNESFREKILTNVSKGRGDIILEEEQLAKPMKKVDCDRITNQFFGYLRREWEEGRLYIAGRDEDYV